MDLRSILMGLVFVAMWSSAFTAARIAVQDAPPFLLLSVRFALAGVIALIIAFALGQSIRLSRRQWISVVVFGICQNTLYLGFNFVAVTTIEASVAVIVASALPLIVAGASWVFLRDRLPPLGVAGLFVGLAGVALIMGSRLEAGTDLVGVAYCLAGVAALAIATLTVRNATSGGNILMIVGLQMLVGSVTLLPVSILLEVWVVNWTASLGWSFAYMVLVPGLMATVIWFLLVGRIGATRAATYHFLNPFFGVAVAAIILGEPLSLRDLIGVLIIMGGILAVQLSRRR